MVTCVDIVDSTMLSGCRDGKIFIWNILNQNGKYSFEIKKKYKGHLGGVLNLVLAPKTKSFMVSAGD